MNKRTGWLDEQLDRWIGEGLVSAEQAERIRRLYPSPAAALPWGTVLFSSLAACRNLPHADLIWHGRLATRAFAGGRID
jgi:hypothetical protein